MCNNYAHMTRSSSGDLCLAFLIIKFNPESPAKMIKRHEYDGVGCKPYHPTGDTSMSFT